jgi:hypothetical protein
LAGDFFLKQLAVGRYLSAWADSSAFIWAEDGSSHAVFTDAQLGHSVQLIPSQPLILL